MASSSHQPNHNPHFFKVVLANALKEQKLEIPKKFVKEHAAKAFLTNQICLKVADGKKWNVGLTKNNGRVWFYYGWQKLVDFYSIGLEYFLVFKYECQSSTFHVVIFDNTATEIEYPTEKIHTEEKVKMEIIDLDFYPQVGRVSLSTPNKQMKGQDGARKTPPSTGSHRARAMEKAIAFQSKTQNPSFMCKIWPSHIEPAKSIHVPQSFTEMHLEEPMEMILEVSELGRIWSIHCGFYWSRKNRNRQRVAELRNGWKKFAHANNLRVGDACVFQMIRKKPTKTYFKVDIFRAS